MNHGLFTANATGTLVSITFPRKDYAFVPRGLPPEWEFPVELWPLLAEAREALGTLNGIGQILNNPDLLLKPLQNREAIASSSIEGTYVTPEQLLLYRLDPREPSSATDQRAEWQEVFAYGSTLEFGCAQLQTIPICNRLIRGMHEVLMRGVRGRNSTPGEFRKMHVQIGSSGRYVPPLPDEAQRLMHDLEQFINSPSDKYDPLILAYIVHYQFEAIHPFSDGNGRVGRALMALMIYKQLKHAKPWLYLSAFFEKYKDEYIENLFRVSTDGRWTEWIEFCLRATITQANDSIRRCHIFNRLRQNFHDLAANAPSLRTHRIIENLFSQPVISVRNIRELCDVSYGTARADIQKLVDCGILKEIDGSHPASYYAPELMRAAYDEHNEESAAADGRNS